MSLYNMLFGENPMAEKLLAVLGYTKADVGRYRDCYTIDEEGKIQIVVHTRNGGGNREEYGEVLDKLAQHPWWVKDQDDDFDCTYADVFFQPPEELQAAIKEIHDPSLPTPHEAWQILFKALEKKKE
jgi:hypothetical protein